MIATVIAMSVIMLIAAVAVAAVNGDTHLTQRDLEGKQAFEAAKAGINDYAFHLNANSGYWSECTDVAKPNAVNQIGSTERRLPVPGSTGAEYAVELIPATGQAACDPASIETARATMLERGEDGLANSFRIRSTGFAGKAKSSIVATFKPPSFLDYVYFTQLETSDPVTYGYERTSSEYANIVSQCSKTWEEGRYSRTISGVGKSCDKINFISDDSINGPLRTNDAMAICGTPTFGRSSSDMIEVGAATPSEHPGWYANCSSRSDDPDFVGTYVSGAPPLEPPSTNEELKTTVLPSFKYKGQVRICLEGAAIKVGNGSSCTKGVNGFTPYSGAIPSNGVIYVEGGSCPANYSPFDTTYPTTSECGNVYVSGTYSSRLTIAAENDIIINGSLIRSESGMLGLIANNFIRIYHPVKLDHYTVCEGWYNRDCHEETRCTGNASGSLQDPVIDAALLAINHSFIVDNYNCGDDLGTLTVNGAIAQNFRGAVGTGSSGSTSTGYAKSYTYDDRLRYNEPPNFVNPKDQSWVIGRETSE